MHTLIATIVALLVCAIFVALLARRMRLPYTVGLVLAGIGIAVTRVHVDLALTQDFILQIILPPLLFEAAINIRWPELKRDMVPVFVLAVMGTLIAAAVVTLGATIGLGWPPQAAALFGALIAATDPVAVIAMFKDNGVKGRLRLLVESESLLNDGVAAVLFGLVLAWTNAAHAGAPPIWLLLHLLGSTVIGGLLAGAVCAGLAMLLVGRTSDHLIESMLTTAAAYGSFVLAEKLHGSGVLATVLTGLLIGNVGVLVERESAPFTKHGRAFILELWDFIAFVANSIIFLLIGVAVSRIHFSELGLRATAFLIGLVLISRALSVYPLASLFHFSKWRFSGAEQHILWWGGLRGALGLALALSLDPALPFRNDVVVATFSIVIFSVVAQGITMPTLLKRLGVSPE